jgi:predicted nucleic acid-binding Zn ribbon protein
MLRIGGIKYMKTCPRCGKENMDEAKFCIWCREELSVNKAKKQNKSIIIAWVAIGFAVVVIVGVGYNILSGTRPNYDQYDEIGEFDSSGYAVVGKETDSDASENYMVYGLINKEGKEILPCEYASIDNSMDYYGYRRISKLPYPFDYTEEYSGVVSPDGNVMISEDCAVISNIGDSGYYIAKETETNMWGIIDDNFEWIQEPDYSWISSIKNDYGYEVEVDGSYVLVAGYDFQEEHVAGIINMYGEMVVPMEYYDIMPWLNGENENLVVIDQDGYYGAIDLRGNIVIPCEYVDIEDVYELLK